MNKKIASFDLVLIFIILIFSFSIFGLRPLVGNNVVYISFMEYLQTKELFVQDIFLKTLDYHPTLFFKFIVMLSNFSNFSIKQILTFLPLPVFYLQAVIFFYYFPTSF